VAVGLAVLPLSLPVLPLHTAVRHEVVKARGDYQSEVGWPAYVHLVERHAAGANVIVAANYGEAGALKVFGRGLPPVASADVTMRYWRPQVAGRRALVVGYSRRAAVFCSGYSVLAHISTANGSDEGGEPIADCIRFTAPSRMSGRGSSRRRTNRCRCQTARGCPAEEPLRGSACDRPGRRSKRRVAECNYDPFVSRGVGNVRGSMAEQALVLPTATNAWAGPWRCVTS